MSITFHIKVKLNAYFSCGFIDKRQTFPGIYVTRYKVSEVKHLTILDLVFPTLLLSNYPLPMELQGRQSKLAALNSN